MRKNQRNFKELAGLTPPIRSGASDTLSLKTPGGAIAAVEERLVRVGIPREEARTEARLLVALGTGRTREALFTQAEEALTDREQETLESLVARRERREPLAYIFEERWFYGLRFRVTSAVLIPRPETEHLVEETLGFLAGRETDTPVRLVDVGTGSGCIAVALAHSLPDTEVFATDLSPEALALAEENARANGAVGHFKWGDLLTPVQADAPFDAIVSNPPYIAPEEMETLQPEVRDWEPRLALGTHPDPLHFYRRLADEAPPLLKPGGLLAVEVGMGQAEAVMALWQDAGLTDIRALPDYGGILRVVRGTRS